MSCQGFEIFGVSGDHRPTRFSGGNDERIYGRPAAGEPTQECSAPCERFRNGRRDITGFQEPVFSGVTTRVALETLNENDRRDTRGPQPRFA
jgi:hypothetical protein